MEKTDVVVKIPKNELRLLEDEQFFGKSKEEWLTAAIHKSIIAELNDMHSIKRIRSLEKKYGLWPLPEPVHF